MEKRKKELLEQYARISQEFDHPSQENKLKTLETELMNPIIERACKEGVCHPKQTTKSSDMEQQVEVQKEIEVETEKEIRLEVYHSKAEEQNYSSWKKSQPAMLTLNQISESATNT